jgi:Ser/Thr protein kinase RdoA (MazF antagonist)
MKHSPDREDSQDIRSALTSIASEPPNFSESEIRHLLNEQYGLAGELRELVSERDQNIRVTTAAGERYVLKIANAAEDAVVADFQIQALLHMNGSAGGVTVPRIVASLEGHAATTITGAQGEHVARVVNYLPGVPLADVKSGVALARNLGTCLANLGIALRDFEHPGDRQVLLWDMQRAGDLRGLTKHVPDIDLRAAVRRCLDDFESNAKPLFSRLRKQVIHSDLNPGNALVCRDDKTKVAGVIDFGDMVRAPLIIDVAIAASYLRSDGGDPLTFVAPFIAAYDRVTPLQNIEFDLLYDLIRTRLITTVTLLQWRLSARGEDDGYSQAAAHSERNAERFFLALSALPAAEFAARISLACGH